MAGAALDDDADAIPDDMTGYTPLDRLMEPIQYVLSEVLENALTHARRDGYRHACVWLASQYFPARGEVHIGVVDDGCGMLATLRAHPDLRQETDHAAILMALQPRISCNRDLRLAGNESINQEVGLTTASRIAEHAGGGMLIVSGSGMHDTQGASGSFSYAWQGVALAIRFRRDQLLDIRFRDLLPSRENSAAVNLRFE
jgi:hypothetical protein